jgi:hypothetical protein
MSENKITILAIHVHENDGIEIEISSQKANMPAITLIGLLEQIKFDLLTNHRNEVDGPNKDLSQYDA